MAQLSEQQNNGGGSDAPAASWKDEFKLRDDLVQRDIYAFESNVAELGGFSTDGSNILAAHALKAAIDAGWLADPDSGEVLTDSKGDKRHMLNKIDVDDMHPGKVRWYGLRIVAHYSKAVAPPPN